MEEIKWMEERCITTENGTEGVLRYYLFWMDGGYGVSIVSFFGEEMEASGFQNICREEKTGKRLLNALARGLVTPMTLREVLYDYMAG